MGRSSAPGKFELPRATLIASCVVGAVLAVLFSAGLVLAFPAPYEGDLQPCPQPDKWAISVWKGLHDVDADEAFVACGEDGVQAAYWLDPETQGWLRWFPGQSEISSLTVVTRWQGVLALGGVVPVAEGSAEATPTPCASTLTPLPEPTVLRTPESTLTPPPPPPATHTPTAEPTPTPEPTVAPVVQTFSGDEDGETYPFPLVQGYAVFSFTWEGIFYVGLYDTAGGQLEWFRGATKGVDIPATANYTLRVQAQRPWTATIVQ